MPTTQNMIDEFKLKEWISWDNRSHLKWIEFAKYEINIKIMKWIKVVEIKSNYKLCEKWIFL
jgi:hypothetical protein